MMTMMMIFLSSFELFILLSSTSSTDKLMRNDTVQTSILSEITSKVSHTNASTSKSTKQAPNLLLSK